MSRQRTTCRSRRVASNSTTLMSAAKPLASRVQLCSIRRSSLAACSSQQYGLVRRRQRVGRAALGARVVHAELIKRRGTVGAGAHLELQDHDARQLINDAQPAPCVLVGGRREPAADQLVARALEALDAGGRHGDRRALHPLGRRLRPGHGEDDSRQPQHRIAFQCLTRTAPDEGEVRWPSARDGAPDRLHVARLFEHDGAEAGRLRLHLRIGGDEHERRRVAGGAQRAQSG